MEPPRKPEGPSETAVRNLEAGGDDDEDELTIGGSLSDLVVPIPRSVL